MLQKIPTFVPRFEKHLSMIRFPNAKINLGLNILSRRPDGYHDIATIFYPAGWCDALEVVPATGGEEGCRLHLSGLAIEGDAGENLVVRAYRLLSQHYAMPPVEAYLHKVIPYGAGLGGGSADASTMLLLLRSLFSLPADDDELAAVAARLGADCPFFIYNRPMLAEGIGDRLSPIDLTLQEYTLLLVKPPVAVSTAEAYSQVVPAQPEVPLCDVVRRPVTEWRDTVVNDFEKSVFALYPELARLKARLYASGAIYASMSGSGSTLYGLFRSLPEGIEEEFPGCSLWSGPCQY